MSHFTIKTLAAELGISPSTVSRALHDHPDISDKTKRRVVETAEKYNYQPNMVAKSLQQKRSNVIGVIVPEIRHNFFSTVISGIEEAAYEAGYVIMVSQSNETLERERINTRAMLANRVAGLLMAVSTETVEYSHLEPALRQGIPLVQFDRVVEELDTGKVVIDDFQAAYGATAHLIDCGYRRIGHLAGRFSGNSVENQGIALNRHRFNGYRAALKNHGLPFEEKFVIPCGYSEEEGRLGAEKILALDERPDAVLAINDPVAVGAFCRFRQAGLRVPDDIALAGFSDNPEAALIEPGLTTVHQPAFEMGRTAAALLLKELDAGEDFVPETVVLDTELLIRGSSRKNGK